LSRLQKHLSGCLIALFAAAIGFGVPGIRPASSKSDTMIKDNGIGVGQVYFIRPEGTLSFYKGKYTAQKEPQASRLYRDFEQGE
jgi:hypothetical protein